MMACESPAPPVSSQSGTLTLARNTRTLPNSDSARGTVYSGIYQAPDGVPVDVWVSIRPTDSGNNIGTLRRIGVQIQGGTGTEVVHILNGDNGQHRVWISINHRGASLTDITADQECIPGSSFLSCLKSHRSFSKTNPHLNAQDANAVISFFTENKEINVQGQQMKAHTFIPTDVSHDAINLLTSSFGGVIVGYMLAEDNRPALHNVFLEQVTAPIEYPISSGLDNADRLLDTLFDACEEDSSCNSNYTNLRTNIRNFMYRYRNTQVSVDGTALYSSGVFERVVHIIENEHRVGKAIRYLGEIIADSTNDRTIDVPNSYEPSGYQAALGEQPQSSYGLPAFTDSRWSETLKTFGTSFFPGITSRVAMICSFGINRATNPDSTNRFNQVKAQQLMEDTSSDASNRKATYGYGFLITYQSFLTLCPQLRNETGALLRPQPSNIHAQNVIVYYGGLDIKHDRADADEMVGYFSSDKAHLINHTYLAQGGGEDRHCLSTVRNNLWAVNTTLTSANRNSLLGDNCEESNSNTASALSGW